jgi:hypothetical protein
MDEVNIIAIESMGRFSPSILVPVGKIVGPGMQKFIF